MTIPRLDSLNDLMKTNLNNNSNDYQHLQMIINSFVDGESEDKKRDLIRNYFQERLIFCLKLDEVRNAYSNPNTSFQLLFLLKKIVLNEIMKAFSRQFESSNLKKQLIFLMSSNILIQNSIELDYLKLFNDENKTQEVDAEKLIKTDSLPNKISEIADKYLNHEKDFADLLHKFIALANQKSFRNTQLSEFAKNKYHLNSLNGNINGKNKSILIQSDLLI